MNLRQIRYFLEIAEHGNFTRASEVLNIAQPALSRQIRLLEEDLGEALFIRSGHGVALTAAGKALRERATVLVYEFDKLRDVVADQSEPRGHLTVGLPPAISHMLSIELVDAYCRQYADVHLHIREGISLDLIAGIQQSKIDCAIVVSDENQGLRSEFLFRETLFLVAPAAEKYDLNQQLTLDRAAGKPLILTNRMNNFRVAIEDAFGRSQLPMRVLADSNSTSMIAALVAKGAAYSILPYCAIAAALSQGLISASPIEGLFVDWAFVSPPQTELTIPAKLFHQMLLDQIHRKVEGNNWLGAVMTTTPAPIRADDQQASIDMLGNGP
ncbi:LysR family transcriptional regulator (plasmid) [Rhizobium grahamii CCGE 502]|uniref:HTH-type transcriptional regulator TtuA n=1 Tax=Rhizobium grahamii CCGE 502 TaxID=990285 RepID=S3I1U8_9HYPH|nr:LysR family transcriptional regulator [Rhizobium grahamii CCGE 502]